MSEQDMSESHPHEFDKSNLRQVILEAPRQFVEGFDLAKEIHIGGDFKRAVFYGEGGSAFPVALVETLARDACERSGRQAPKISQNHTYSLRLEASQDALNIFCSYSGNTEETISTLTKALAEGLPAVVITSGGKLEEIAKEKGVPFVKLPMPNPQFQPRMGTGYLVASMMTILHNHGLIEDLRKEMLEKVPKFESSMGEYEAEGKELAAKIAGKTPLVWSSQKFKELARVWTIKFNEHAKNPAFWNFFPELNHNLMAGMTNHTDQYFAIMLRDPDDDPGNLRRYEIAADVLENYGLESEILDLRGGSAFVKMFDSIYLADFTAYYLAEKNQTDPTSVDMVEEFKAKLDPNFGKK